MGGGVSKQSPGLEKTGTLSKFTKGSSKWWLNSKRHVSFKRGKEAVVAKEGKDQDPATTSRENVVVEDYNKIRWKSWTRSMMTIMSFLELQEVVVLTEVNRQWQRMANRYIERYEPKLPVKEVEWINTQLEQNCSFFEKTMLTSICKLVIQAKENEKGKKRAQIDGDGSNETLVEIRDRILHHRGHYATFPPLAMQLLSSLGRADETTRIHEIIFRCKYIQRRGATSCLQFLQVLYGSISTLYDALGDEFVEMENGLLSEVYKHVEEQAQRLINGDKRIDGRNITVLGILTYDITDALGEYQGKIETSMNRLKRELLGKIKTKSGEVEPFNCQQELELGDHEVVLPEDAEKSCRIRICNFLANYGDVIGRSLTQAFLEPLTAQYTDSAYLVKSVIELVDRHIGQNNPDQRVTDSFSQILGVKNLTCKNKCDRISDQYALYDEQVLPHLKELPEQAPLTFVQVEVDRYLDHFIDQRYVSIEINNDEDGSVATCGNEGEDSLHITEEKCNKNDEEAKIDIDDDHNETEDESKQGDGDNDDSQKYTFPTSREELETCSPGWFVQHLYDIYLKRCEKPVTMEEDKVRAFVREFALRRYVYHVLMRENANRMLNFFPRGALVAAGPQQRIEHCRALGDALRGSLSRDMGNLTAQDKLFLPRSSVAFELRLLRDTDYMTAMVSMSLNQLVSCMDQKRRDIAEFEKHRRKSDLVD